MSGNTFGKIFTVTTFGESHGRALGCIIDGCPPGMDLTEADIQGDLDRRRPGRSRHTSQRNEPDQVKIWSGVFEGKTTGTPIGLIVENTDQRSKDYGDIKDKFRPGHADYTSSGSPWLPAWSSAIFSPGINGRKTPWTAPDPRQPLPLWFPRELRVCVGRTTLRTRNV